MVFVVIYDVHMGDVVLEMLVEVLSLNRVLLMSETLYTPLRLVRRDWSAVVNQSVLMMTVCVVRFVAFEHAILLLCAIANSIAALVFGAHCVGDLAIVHVVLTGICGAEFLTNIFVACYLRTVLFVCVAVWIQKQTLVHHNG